MFCLRFSYSSNCRWALDLRWLLSWSTRPSPLTLLLGRDLFLLVSQVCMLWKYIFVVVFEFQTLFKICMLSIICSQYFHECEVFAFLFYLMVIVISSAHDIFIKGGTESPRPDSLARSLAIRSTLSLTLTQSSACTRYCADFISLIGELQQRGFLQGLSRAASVRRWVLFLAIQ